MTIPTAPKKRTLKDAAREALVLSKMQQGSKGMTPAQGGSGTALKAQPPLPTQPTEPPLKQPKPPRPLEDITFVCGHTANVKRKGKNRPENKCPACRAADCQALLEKQKAEAATRKAAKPPKPFKKHWPPDLPQGRLPDGSRFENLTWRAETETWRGQLQIPVAGPDPKTDGVSYKVFDATCGGVFRLLEKLDKMYRVWERDCKAAAATSDTVIPPEASA